MKNLFVLLLVFAALTTQAQTDANPPQKIGHADWEYIFSQLPESKQIDNDMKTHEGQLQSQLKAKYTEFQAKANAFQGMPATTPDAIKKDKETELTQMQESIQKFQQDAQASMQKKQADLMQPVFAKVAKAIEEVAKENNYSYIIAPQVLGGGDILLYNDEKNNISVLVLKKLGITPTAATTTTAVPPKKN
jgi:outer membrane protein